MAEKSGGGGDSDFGWYHEMIHDALYGNWEQPTSLYSEGHVFSCVLQIHIHKDGTISDPEITKSSGNPVMDESVLAAAKRTLKIAPLPEGLSKGDSYTINIAFELNQN
jgi:TonB family protein